MFLLKRHSEFPALPTMLLDYRVPLGFSPPSRLRTKADAAALYSVQLSHLLYVVNRSASRASAFMPIISQIRRVPASHSGSVLLSNAAKRWTRKQ